MNKNSEIRRLSQAGSIASTSGTNHRRAQSSTVPQQCYFCITPSEEGYFLRDPQPERPRLDANGNEMLQPEYTLVTLCDANGVIKMANVAGSVEMIEICMRFFTSWWSKRRNKVQAIPDPKNPKVTASLRILSTETAKGTAVELMDEMPDYDSAYEYFVKEKMVFRFQKGPVFKTEDIFARDANQNPIVNATRDDWTPTIDIVEGVKWSKPSTVSQEDAAKAAAINAAQEALEAAKAEFENLPEDATDAQKKAAEKKVEKAQQKYNEAVAA